MYHTSDDGWSDSGTRQEQVTFETQVGIQLIANIEGLPDTPLEYSSPPTWSNPGQSMNVANQYLDCGGMCFAVSMARVDQAYQDAHNESPLNTTNFTSMDYNISGSGSVNINTIPDQVLGYGVGGALANNNRGNTFNDADFWNGEAQIGAALQYWFNQASIQAVQTDLLNSNGASGHSLIFNNYTYDNNGDIDGFSYYDFHGLHTVTRASWTAARITVGANLIDP